MSSLHLKWWNKINRKQLVVDFLRLPTHRGKTIDAYKACQECNRRWGIVIDWHEFAYALENMVARDEAVIYRAGHITVYRIKEVE